MSLKNSQAIEDLKHEYIYGSVHDDGRRSFKSLDNLIKQHQLAAATIYRCSSKESWKNQRIAFRAELSEEIKKAKKHDIVNDIQFIQNKATIGLSLILDKAISCLQKDKSINPRGLYNLAQTIITCSRNLPAITESEEDDNEGFRKVMEMLDQIAAFKRDTPGFDFK
jgi:PII-like signaling protein